MVLSEWQFETHRQSFWHHKAPWGDFTPPSHFPPYDHKSVVQVLEILMDRRIFATRYASKKPISLSIIFTAHFHRSNVMQFNSNSFSLSLPLLSRSSHIRWTADYRRARTFHQHIQWSISCARKTDEARSRFEYRGQRRRGTHTPLSIYR